MNRQEDTGRVGGRRGHLSFSGFTNSRYVFFFYSFFHFKFIIVKFVKFGMFKILIF